MRRSKKDFASSHGQGENVVGTSDMVILEGHEQSRIPRNGKATNHTTSTVTSIGSDDIARLCWAETLSDALRRDNLAGGRTNHTTKPYWRLSRFLLSL